MIALKEILKQVDSLLAGTNADGSEREWIACEALGIKRGALPLVREVSEEQAKKMIDYARERATGRPLWQVFGYAEFCGMRIEVGEGVLCPRPETEELVERAAAYCCPGVKALDMCTGSGCIAIALAKTGADVTASDISERALEIAARNAEANGAKVRFLLSDVWENIDGRFDVIVSNPPYIPTEQIASLDREVRDFEPHCALDGGEDGLKFYREIAKGLAAHLEEGGILLVEMGAEQGEALKAMFAPFGEVKIVKDIEGKDRIAAVRICGKN